MVATSTSVKKYESCLWFSPYNLMSTLFDFASSSLSTVDDEFNSHIYKKLVKPPLICSVDLFIRYYISFVIHLMLNSRNVVLLRQTYDNFFTTMSFTLAKLHLPDKYSAHFFRANALTVSMLVLSIFQASSLCCKLLIAFREWMRTFLFISVRVFEVEIRTNFILSNYFVDETIK